MVFQLKSFNNQNYLSRMKGEFWKTDSNGGRVYESPHKIKRGESDFKNSCNCMTAFPTNRGDKAL